MRDLTSPGRARTQIQIAYWRYERTQSVNHQSMRLRCSARRIRDLVPALYVKNPG